MPKLNAWGVCVRPFLGYGRRTKKLPTLVRSVSLRIELARQ